MGLASVPQLHHAGDAEMTPTVTRITVCRECGEELDPAESDITGLCDACWEDLTVEEPIPDWDDVGDPLSRRDDEMGM